MHIRVIGRERFRIESFHGRQPSIKSIVTGYERDGPDRSDHEAKCRRDYHGEGDSRAEGPSLCSEVELCNGKGSRNRRVAY